MSEDMLETVMKETKKGLYRIDNVDLLKAKRLVDQLQQVGTIAFITEMSE